MHEPAVKNSDQICQSAPIAMMQNIVIACASLKIGLNIAGFVCRKVSWIFHDPAIGICRSHEGRVEKKFLKNTQIMRRVVHACIGFLQTKGW